MTTIGGCDFAAVADPARAIEILDASALLRGNGSVYASAIGSDDAWPAIDFGTFVGETVSAPAVSRGLCVADSAICRG